MRQNLRKLGVFAVFALSVQGCRTTGGSQGSEVASRNVTATAGKIYTFNCTCDKDSSDDDCNVKASFTLSDDTASILIDGRNKTGKVAESRAKDAKHTVRYSGFGPILDLAYPSDIVIDDDMLDGHKGSIDVVDTDGNPKPTTLKCKLF